MRRELLSTLWRPVDTMLGYQRRYSTHIGILNKRIFAWQLQSLMPMHKDVVGVL